MQYLWDFIQTSTYFFNHITRILPGDSFHVLAPENSTYLFELLISLKNPRISKFIHWVKNAFIDFSFFMNFYDHNFRM